MLCDSKKHSSSNCLYPEVVERCHFCGYNIIENDPLHSCVESRVDHYRRAVFAKVPETVFKLRCQSSEAQLHYLDEQEHKFKELYDGQHLLNPATSGMFRVSRSRFHNFIFYDALKNLNFSFYIATFSNGKPSVTLRAVVSAGHIAFIPCQFELQHRQGKYRVNTSRRLHSALILGLLTTKEKVNLQVKLFESPTKVVSWSSEKRRWDIAAGINVPNRIHRNDNYASEHCLNCDQPHNTEICHLPFFSLHCYNCLVSSFTGRKHTNPCCSINTISNIRSDIASVNALTLYELKYTTTDIKAYMLIEGRLEEVTTKLKLLAPAANSAIVVKDIESKRCIALKQTQFNRSGILIAIKDNKNLWRLRFNAVVTAKHGLTVFPITRTLTEENGRYEIPETYRNSTIALIAIDFEFLEGYLEFRVYANKDGKIETARFSGFEAHISINLQEDDIIQIPYELTGKKEMKFNRKLNNEPRQKALSTFQEQRIAK